MYCSELFFTLVPNSSDLKLLFVFGSAGGIWITQGLKGSSNLTSLCNASALCHSDTAAPGEFTSSREDWEIKLFSKGRQTPTVTTSPRKSRAWSLSKSPIYFNFLPSRWDTPSVPTHPLTLAGLPGDMFLQYVPHACEMSKGLNILNIIITSPDWGYLLPARWRAASSLFMHPWTGASNIWECCLLFPWVKMLRRIDRTFNLAHKTFMSIRTCYDWQMWKTNN